MTDILDTYGITTVIIERCRCGESRIAPSGNEKYTQVYIPDRLKGKA